MHNYSENWHHIKSILKGYEVKYNRYDVYSYKDHRDAKVLAIFLANATLATPKLNRETVEKVLSGSLTWTNSTAAPKFERVDLSVSFLEENGFVSFHADWCSIHCESVNETNNIDPSLTPLIQAIEHLKDICYGRNGYVQPYYELNEEQLRMKLSADFGNLFSKGPVPLLCLEDGCFKLSPDNQSFDSLVSTYLWQVLRETLNPEDAFESWILCLRVNCSWLMPVLFGDDEARNEFNNLLLAYIEKDAGLNLSMNTLFKQALNEESFSQIVFPVTTSVNIQIDQAGGVRTEHVDTIPREKPTLKMIPEDYKTQCIENYDDIQIIKKWQQAHSWREPQQFYTGLLDSVIKDDINVDEQLLSSNGLTEKLLKLAASRPILKHILFNVLPEYNNAMYQIYLLSQPATCDVALFYLTQKSFSNSHRESHSFTKHVDKGFQQIVCYEYLRAIESELDSGDRLFKIVGFLGERCNIQDRNFSKSFEYQYLVSLLDSLNNERIFQIGQVFSRHLHETNTTSVQHNSQQYWYFLGFWLIERLEDAGIDREGALTNRVKDVLLGYYKAEFEQNLTGERHSLEPSIFFSALPWHKIIGNDRISEILKPSNQCSAWQEKLLYTNDYSFAIASAVRQYLQVLMNIGRSQTNPKDCERVANRALEIVRIVGFKSSEQYSYLFESAFYVNKYDLWPTFCSYTNLLQDSQYDEFVDRCLSLIPLDQLFVLFERCTVIARNQRLQEEIATRQFSEAENLGLSGLEQAFISAWNANNIALSTKLLDKARMLLEEERFTRNNNPHITRIRNSWLSYEYKLQLLILLESTKDDPKRFHELANEINIPHKHGSNTNQMDDRECEYFRRYIIAAAYCETKPQRCIDIMESLCQASDSNDHRFMLFRGRIALHKINPDATELRYALSQFLEKLGDVDPKDMQTAWVATILDTYRELQNSIEIDMFWKKLSPDQQDIREVMLPYCLALVKRGDALIAQQIVNRYQQHNSQALDELGISDLINVLLKTNKMSTTQLIQVLNEDSQRDITQLKKHYSQIVSKDFEDYVTIVGQGKPPHEFLKDIVLEIAHELLLRKKNLQLHSDNSSNKTDIKITKEDLINDWFTSLFDKRMAEARIGFRDQKRGGESSSGKSPGEIDGFITDAQNKRVSLFEAFRLFSLDISVISTHLNKISHYDNESLSPVFIVVYCDVNDFQKLCTNYSDQIRVLNYEGFCESSDVSLPRETDNLCLISDTRTRGIKKIIFYHLLLNMHFSTKQ